MIEVRTKIMYGHDLKLSIHNALDCSIYNLGCGGGYPFLVMKFTNEFDLIAEICKPYYVSGLIKQINSLIYPSFFFLKIKNSNFFK